VNLATQRNDVNHLARAEADRNEARNEARNIRLSYRRTCSPAIRPILLLNVS